MVGFLYRNIFRRISAEQIFQVAVAGLGGRNDKIYLDFDPVLLRSSIYTSKRMLLIMLIILELPCYGTEIIGTM